MVPFTFLGLVSYARPRNFVAPPIFTSCEYAAGPRFTSMPEDQVLPWLPLSWTIIFARLVFEFGCDTVEDALDAIVRGVGARAKKKREEEDEEDDVVAVDEDGEEEEEAAAAAAAVEEEEIVNA